MTERAPSTEAPTGEELLDIRLDVPHRREVWEQGPMVVRVLKPVEGKAMYLGEAGFVPRDQMGRQVGPPRQFCFKIKAVNVADAFDKFEDTLKLAGPAYVRRFMEIAKAASRRIIAATDEPEFRPGGASGLKVVRQ